MFKADMHIHSRHSNDGLSSPKDIARMAKKRGLDAIAITDHNTTGAWRGMREACRKEGLQLILGEEVKVKENGKTMGEILAYFISSEIRPASAEEIIDAIREQGGLAVIAHPFDPKRHQFRRMELAARVDAIEAFNSGVVLNRWNERATEFARENNMPVVAGSDAHMARVVGNAFTIAGCSDTEGLRKAIKAGKTSFSGKRTNLFLHAITPLGRIGKVIHGSDF